jgi:DNA-binding Xre family transcriptional regulator
MALAEKMAHDYPRGLFKAARIALKINNKRFAELAQISVSTLSIVEVSQKHVGTRTIDKIGKALEKEGIEFLPSEPGKGPGFRITFADNK